MQPSPDDEQPPHGLSAHALMRLRQRGLHASDVEVVLANGTEYDEAVVLTAADVAESIAVRKREIADLERLSGAAVILAGAGLVATVYRPDSRRMQRLQGRRPRPTRSRSH